MPPQLSSPFIPCQSSHAGRACSHDHTANTVTEGYPSAKAVVHVWTSVLSTLLESRNFLLLSKSEIPLSLKWNCNRGNHVLSHSVDKWLKKSNEPLECCCLSYNKNRRQTFIWQRWSCLCHSSWHMCYKMYLYIWFSLLVHSEKKHVMPYLGCHGELVLSSLPFPLSNSSSFHFDSLPNCQG